MAGLFPDARHMALTATVRKAELQISDMDRGYDEADRRSSARAGVEHTKGVTDKVLSVTPLSLSWMESSLLSFAAIVGMHVVHGALKCWVRSGTQPIS